MVTPINGAKIAGLQQTFALKGMGKVLVVEPGRLQSLSGIDSLKRLPNLHQELTNLIRTKFGIEVSDIFCDREAKLEILGCNPSFLERIRNANGNLEVLGHTVVFEMKNETRGKLYLLGNSNNIEKIESPTKQKSSPRIDPEAKLVLLDKEIYPLFKLPTYEEILEVIAKPKAFAKELPEAPVAKLDFLLSCLIVWSGETSKNPPKHLLDELTDLFIDTNNDPTLFKLALDYIISDLQSSSSRKIAPLIALKAIPIPPESRDLPPIASCIAYIISKDSSPWLLRSAADTALKLGNKFDADSKLKIWQAAGLRQPDCIAKSSEKIFRDEWLAAARSLGRIKADWKGAILSSKPDFFPAMLESIEDALKFLSQSRGENYYKEHEYRDVKDIYQFVSRLHAELQNLKLIISEENLSSKIDRLLTDISEGLAKRNILPRSYAEAGREILDLIWASMELADKIKNGEFEDLK